MLIDILEELEHCFTVLLSLYKLFAVLIKLLCLFPIPMTIEFPYSKFSGKDDSLVTGADSEAGHEGVGRLLQCLSGLPPSPRRQLSIRLWITVTGK